MAFTTWAAFYQTLLNDLANGNWRTKSYTLEGYSKTYRDIKEFLDLVEYAKQRAAEETGAVGGRTYAKQGGGGRW